MRVSLSEFFSVEVEPHELKRCLDYTSSECKLAAWYGDALLAMFVSQRIYEKDPHNIGTMTRMKAHYVSNSTMKEFMRCHTDALSRLTDEASMSVHSYGTVFEALLELCHAKSGQVVAKSCVDKYCDWVDANSDVPSTSISISYCDFETGMKGFTNFPKIDAFTLESIEKTNTMVVQGLQSWFGETKAAKVNEARVRAAKVAKAEKEIELKKQPQVSKSCPSSALSEPSEHIHREMATAEWRSNSKIPYTDLYYRCCGVREGVLTCLRPLWIDAAASCYHPGTLNIPGKKAVFQAGASQFGKGKTPNWNCCGLTAVAPGCVSNQPDNLIRSVVTGIQRPSSNYMTKIRQWLTEYEHVVKQESERAVGYGGAVLSSNNLTLSKKRPLSALYFDDGI